MSTNDGCTLFCPNCIWFNEQNRGRPGPYECTSCGTVWEVEYNLIEKLIPTKYYEMKIVIIREGKKN